MLTYEFLRKLGVFIVENFVDSQTCQKFRELADQAPLQPTTIARKNTEYVDPSVRRSSHALVDSTALDLITDRLKSLIPSLNEFFKLSLSDCQVPKFLIFDLDDFISPHTDTSDHVDAPDYVRRRQLTAVIFLNDASTKATATSLEGGDLTIYGLLGGTEWDQTGFPISPKEGSLVAFPANLFHEVSTVKIGRRFSVVAWYF